MEDVSFGQWLSRHRKSLGLTQKQLAERANCAAITVRKIEAEHRHPSLQIAERLAQVLNIPMEERMVFISFARGLRTSPPSAMVNNRPWRVAGASITAGQPARLPSFLAASQTNIWNELLGGRVRLVSLAGSPRIALANLSSELSIEATAMPADKNYLFLLVPVEITTPVAMSFIQSLGSSGVRHKIHPY